MSTIDQLRNDIINKLLHISNQEYLETIANIINNSSLDLKNVALTNEQIIMLQLSEDDIKNDRLIGQAQVDQQDLKWLKEL